MATRLQSKPSISGSVRPGFEAVRGAFLENFELRGELGAACCVYLRGEKVVDLWGGVRDKTTGAPWEEDTMVLVYSTTKGLSALAMALAHSRGLFDYDHWVANYWPEFGQQGKERITVRRLFAHQAGLFAVPGLGDRELVADLDRLAKVLAAQKPEWEPGSRQCYHAISLGYYQSELLRRVDPLRRSLGRFFQEELAAPLGLDFYIRLPEAIPDERLATLDSSSYSLATAAFHLPVGFFLGLMNPRSPLSRSMVGTTLGLDPQRVYARELEVPSGGGVGTARAIARAYSAFACGGSELDLGSETLRELMAPPVPSANGFHDDALSSDARFSLGLAKPGPFNPFGPACAFGHPGAGGSFGFADPSTQLGYGYVCNRMGTYLIDPRDVALRQALDACLKRS